MQSQAISRLKFIDPMAGIGRRSPVRHRDMRELSRWRWRESRIAIARLFGFSGPCTLAAEATQAWAERSISTAFLVVCISTAVVWTSSLVIAMLHLVMLAGRQ